METCEDGEVVDGEGVREIWVGEYGEVRTFCRSVVLVLGTGV